MTAKNRFLRAGLVFGLILLGMTGQARANLSLFFQGNGTFSGTAPTGTLSAVFTDVAGGVDLTITSNLGTGGAGENLDPGKALYLNFEKGSPTQAVDLAALNFQLISNTNFSQQATVMTGINSFKPDGDGNFDILFTYSKGTKAFLNGESQTYFITGNGVTSADFDFKSEIAPGVGSQWTGAVHIQNTPNGGSGSAFVGDTSPGSPPGVPEPSTMALAALGGLGFLGYGLRRRLKK
jgi:hypothetical protein